MFKCTLMKEQINHLKSKIYLRIETNTIPLYTHYGQVVFSFSFPFNFGWFWFTPPTQHVYRSLGMCINHYITIHGYLPTTNCFISPTSSKWNGLRRRFFFHFLKLQNAQLQLKNVKIRNEIHYTLLYLHHLLLQSFKNTVLTF